MLLCAGPPTDGAPVLSFGFWDSIDTHLHRWHWHDRGPFRRWLAERVCEHYDYVVGDPEGRTFFLRRQPKRRANA